MAGCCSSDDIDREALVGAYRRVLWIVIAINATMFVVELTG